ncbi:MAG: hypothetical protein A3I89_02200 [Candidatus Harrisonbacteria bacterium RIFCSPLOWO2_02_FULL_41_11]|uniref:Uncharacterized protein n=1 Tax=Candidatus Harrisonbacteria bacterium RIFCSPHIGHO2_02_FULL_42_16 TaxID=1798404 RepID=A0A1G1ZJ66_9BACT|nr:MAG: hypothetical protein A3B92_00125 [Candidatus Harrisonbacteria bacterium RIFCSPHIGHO2_02_FULL_42_16]OGY67546.1 MAG: hypothetical protein A3I89_02200 [Candidatus Harrisonbacteria bacterium RIFCSPLOWO2_02_FULL_41_11]
MVEQNLPLYRWQEYVKPEEPLRYSGWSSKNLEKTVRIIVNGLSSPEVVELVAEEFNSLPPLVRMALTNECNIARNESRSGNKNKGIARLDQRLGGRVLKKTDERLTDRKLITVNGELVSVDQKLNPAVIGATRAYAAGYIPKSQNFSPKERRELRKEKRRQRREQRWVAKE